MNLKKKVTIIQVIYDNNCNLLKNLNKIKDFKIIIVDNQGNDLILKDLKIFRLFLIRKILGLVKRLI